LVQFKYMNKQTMIQKFNWNEEMIEEKKNNKNSGKQLFIDILKLTIPFLIFLLWFVFN